MKPSLAGLVIVVVCFCAPLFVGLGRADLRGDEAGHSFSVDRILETGDWLVPKSSPQENQAFLEKPPLKFWIVALPIRLGLLPHDEFGLRFWDALFGSLAFLYVYAMGRRLAGAVSGVVAVLLLFAFYPLVFDHGLRTNNMEAALLLCYCGGVYHFMAAADAEKGIGHASAVAAYFTLGFLTKFVAALFLPFVLLVAACCLARYREGVRCHWKGWLGACALAAALIAPWFVYATLRFGRELWAIMLGQHVLERMTTSLNPEHIQPWPYYWTTLYKTFTYAGSAALVMLGFVALLIQAVRRRWADAALVIIWAIVPLALISLGTSKLIHYMYPFMPPFALAGGYLAGMVVMLAPAPLERIRWPRALMALTALLLATLALSTAAYGEVRLALFGHLLFRNATVFRPIAAALVAASLALGTRRYARIAAVSLVLFLSPLPAYTQDLFRLNAGTAPLRDMRDCLRRVQGNGTGAQGLYVDVPDSAMQHQTYYYFRAIRPWVRADDAVAVDLNAFHANMAARKPMLFSEPRFQELFRRVAVRDAAGVEERAPVPRSVRMDNVRVLLPEPSAACIPVSSQR